jgi:hypothetical protein
MARSRVVTLGILRRTGKQALDKIYGAHIFDFLKQQPAEGQIFHDAMTELSMIDGPAIAEAYDFEGIHSIVDIAGGYGFLLAIILERNPHLQGTLYEVPHVVQGAANGPLKPLMERCTLASGDMFSSVPAGADAYMMKHIICERTEEQFRDLFDAVGWQLRRIIPTAATDSVVEGVPA